MSAVVARHGSQALAASLNEGSDFLPWAKGQELGMQNIGGNGAPTRVSIQKPAWGAIGEITDVAEVGVL